MTKVQNKSCIVTRSSQYFDYLRPHDYDYQIEEIAHALSNLCRFTGHGNKFYSVAEHSVLVSNIVPEEFALEALLHDATEAFVGDVASPLKALLPDYKVIEKNIYKCIANTFGIPMVMSKEVHEADNLAYWIERSQLCFTTPDTLTPLLNKENAYRGNSVSLKVFPPKEAYSNFLQRYVDLTNERKITLAEKLSESSYQFALSF
jgi:hypothetical protein